MIARLSGILVDVELTRCVIDVHGVGYGVNIPLSTYEKLPKLGEGTTLSIHTSVREDDISLFGFFTKDEHDLFLMLTSVSGIGPKSALNILSCMPATQFAKAVCSNDLITLQKINGIGKKSAERLVVELRDKLNKYTLGALFTPNTSSSLSEAAQDALLALEQLGFKRETVTKVILKLTETLPVEQSSSEQIIRRALAVLNG